MERRAIHSDQKQTHMAEDKASCEMLEESHHETVLKDGLFKDVFAFTTQISVVNSAINAVSPISYCISLMQNKKKNNPI